MITISEKELTAIREHGISDYPYECCGLLLGRFGPDGKIVTETYPISNAREESAKRNRFLITPEELMKGERYARDHDLKSSGFIIRIRIRRQCRRNTTSSTPGPLTRTSSFLPERIRRPIFSRGSRNPIVRVLTRRKSNVSNH